MPAKKNAETGGLEAPPLVKTDSLHARHVEAQAKRRALEAELAEINGQIATVIRAGDVEAMRKLKARHGNLPELYVEASMAETSVRQELYSAIEAANLEAFNAAQARRDQLLEEIVETRNAFEAKLADLSQSLIQAEAAFGAAQSTIFSARNIAAEANVACDRALSKLAGV